jgi:hypothetical protein
MMEKSSLIRGYQELCQVHFCRISTMFVDIADTTVSNLIYNVYLKNEMLTS